MCSARVYKLLLTATFVGFIGCATQASDTGSTNKSPIKVDESKEPELTDVILKFDKKGNLVPVTEDGKPYEVCYEKGGNVCRIFKDKVKISTLKTTTILQVQYDVNPENCRFIKIIQNGIETNLIHPADRHKDC